MEETVGYKANKEMEELLFNTSGIYKHKQITKAASITLKSAYSEIAVYWDQEIRFRPKFKVDGEYAKMPVFFSKVNGIDENERKYWKSIKELMTDNAITIKKPRFVKIGLFKRVGARFIGCFRKHEIDITKVKKSKAYKYKYLRTATQDHILEKLKYIIDNRIIKGTFKSGVEFLVLEIALNMPKNVIKLLHDFDFVRRNPKIIYIHIENKVMPIEDTILLVLLHYLGFDIVIFSPNGINCMDEYLNVRLIEEFEIGNYKEISKVPNFFWV